MRWLVFATLLLSSTAWGQVEEARKLVATPPDSAGIRRTVELLQTGDDAAKRVLTRAWLRGDYEEYLTRLKEVQRWRSYESLYKDAAEAIKAFASKDPEALRELAWAEGSDGVPGRGMEMGSGCGTRSYPFFAYECETAFSDICKQSADRIVPLMKDPDARVADAAMKGASEAGRDDAVRAEALRRLRDKDPGVRHIAAAHLLASPIPPEYAKDARRLVETADPDTLAWLAVFGSVDLVEKLYPSTPFEKLPAGARYLSIANWNEETAQDGLTLASSDPDVEVAALAAFRGRNVLETLRALWPRLRQSKRLGSYVDSMVFPDLLAEGWDWRTLLRMGGAEAARALMSTLSADDPQPEEMALGLISYLEEADGTSGTASWLTKGWPRFRGVAERMLRSKSTEIRRVAAVELMVSPNLAPLYLDRVAVDRDSDVRYEALVVSDEYLKEHGATLIPRILRGLDSTDINSTVYRIVYLQLPCRDAVLRELAKSRDARVAEYARAQLGDLNG